MGNWILNSGLHSLGTSTRTGFHNALLFVNPSWQRRSRKLKAPLPVYKKHRLIHIHIPKTGGTAIEAQFDALGDLTCGSEGWFGVEQRDGRWYEFQHLSMTELQTLSHSQYADFESFAVVRNPYHRLLSDYTWRRHIQKAYPSAAIPAFASFDAFIQSIPRDINTCWNAYVNNANREDANFLIHVRPQYHYIAKYDELNGLNHILTFERLKDEIETILTPRDIPTSQFRNGTEIDIAAHFTRTQLDIVNAIYERDFQAFSYEMI